MKKILILSSVLICVLAPTSVGAKAVRKSANHTSYCAKDELRVQGSCWSNDRLNKYSAQIMAETEAEKNGKPVDVEFHRKAEQFLVDLEAAHQAFLMQKMADGMRGASPNLFCRAAVGSYVDSAYGPGSSAHGRAADDVVQSCF